MGIDGGGTSVRVVITTSDLTIAGESRGETVNPSVVGRDVAASRIHNAIHAALDQARLTPDAIASVGIGVAGAGAAHSADWLHEVIHAVLPYARVVPSADYEIALTGAQGERRGLLVLAGTGSLTYGVNAAGESALVGGWGYWLGDEGSGYWLGLEAIRAAIYASDGRDLDTTLLSTVLETLNLAAIRDLVPWLYRAEQPRQPEIAAFAPAVLDAAGKGDSVAQTIVTRAADALAAQADAVRRQLHDESLPIAFTGGLLSTANRLSDALCARLHLTELPIPRYPPVVGAAILARTALNRADSKN